MKSSINIDKKNTEAYIKENTLRQYFHCAGRSIRVCFKGDDWLVPYDDNDLDEVIRLLKFKGKSPKATQDYLFGFKCWIVSWT